MKIWIILLALLTTANEKAEAFGSGCESGEAAKYPKRNTG